MKYLKIGWLTKSQSEISFANPTKNDLSHLILRPDEVNSRITLVNFLSYQSKEWIITNLVIINHL